MSHDPFDPDDAEAFPEHYDRAMEEEADEAIREDAEPDDQECRWCGRPFRGRGTCTACGGKN